MIHPKVRELVQEVFGWFDEKEGKRAGEYPEVYLVSLLEGIKEDLPEASATLYFTVEMAGFGSDTKRFQKVLAVVQPSEKMRPCKVGRKSLKRQYYRKKPRGKKTAGGHL